MPIKITLNLDQELVSLLGKYNYKPEDLQIVTPLKFAEIMACLCENMHYEDLKIEETDSGLIIVPSWTMPERGHYVDADSD